MSQGQARRETASFSNPAATARLRPARWCVLAYKYAGSPGAAANMAEALARANEAKEAQKASLPAPTLGGSTKTPVSGEQEEVGDMGPFVADSRKFPGAIEARSLAAFAFGRDYLEGMA